MGFYEDFVNGLKGSVGEGKAFEKNVDMAEFLGKPPAYTHRLMSGDRGKTLESVGKLLDKLGAKLVFPEEGGALPTMSRVSSHAPKEIVQGDDLPRVPVLMEAGAGPDIEVFSGDVGDTIPILPAYWLPGMWAVRIKGDSMEPLIKSGACVGVVPLEGDFIEGGLYLVRMPHFGYVVKRVRMGDDGLMLLSENPKIPPRHVPFEGHENIIAGRVVWFWQMCE